MKKLIALGGGLLLVFGFIVIVPVIAIVSLMANANAQCVDPATLTHDAGGPVRVPVAHRWGTTSEWGLRIHPIRGDLSKHKGLDFTGGPQILAAKAGVVTAMPTTAGEGQEIVLDHGTGVQTKYKHLAARSVSVGDRVWAGREIGTMGSTGQWSTGPHLHFEVWVNGADVNPREWLGIGATRNGDGGAPAPSGSTGEGDVVAVDHRETSTGGTTNAAIGRMPPAIGPYKGEQLVNAGHIIVAGQRMGLDARTITIGVMTAIGESSLINIDRGDAVGPDSRGLFQQRANGAWGTYEDRMNPQTAATNFFKALLKVPGYAQLEPTIAAHRTQRNANPNHYARFWPDAVQIVSTLTADPSLLAELGAGHNYSGCENGPLEGSGDGSGQAIVDAAMKYVDTPYSWGGGDETGPTRGIRSSPTLDGTGIVGFDCSGLVLFAVHHATGITLEHHSERQGTDPRGRDVPRDWAAMQPGDIISISDNGSGAPGTFNHVGIYVGAGKMIHAPRPGKNVEVVQIQGNDYWEGKAWKIKRYASA